MKIRRLIYLISIFAAASLVGNFLQADGDSRKYSENYPELVCPNVGSATTTQVSLTTSKRRIRYIPNKSFKLMSAKTNRLQTTSSSVVIDGLGTSSFAWISKSGVWAGGVNCLSPQAEQYFVGGSGDISSKSKLIVINSGLSASIVDVFTYSEGGNLKKTINIAKNQIATLNVVSLAPGAKSVGMRVIPRTGRVTSYLVDERGKGLRLLGGDIINSQSQLSKVLYISGIPHNQKNKTHVLRILNAGAANTVISVEVLSKEGRYIPVGLDNRKIAFGKVADISFDVNSKVTAFGLKITSDQPIAASVYSRTGSDFVWSSAVTTGVKGTWAITGLDPTLHLVGDQIQATITLLMPKRKEISKKLEGTDFLSYLLPKGAIGFRIDSISSKTAGSLLVTSQSGIGYLPLVNGSVLTRSTVPTANIGVLNP